MSPLNSTWEIFLQKVISTTQKVILSWEFSYVILMRALFICYRVFWAPHKINGYNLFYFIFVITYICSLPRSDYLCGVIFYWRHYEENKLEVGYYAVVRGLFDVLNGDLSSIQQSSIITKNDEAMIKRVGRSHSKNDP